MNVLKTILLLTIIFVLTACNDSATHGEMYPWQATPVANGNSRVFGIELGKATFDDAEDVLGRLYDAAVFENPDGGLSLEVYYKEVTLAGLTAKFVFTLNASEATKQRLKGRPLKRERLQSGVIKYTVAKNDDDVLLPLEITAITYMPITNLDEDIVSRRFGQPAEKIRTHKSAQHWLYPEKGLDVIINAEGKDVLEYVPPREFDKLVKPLKQKRLAKPKQ